MLPVEAALHCFPSTAQCLIDGDDPRLLLDARSGRNHYLCRPHVEPDLLRLGSSTASAISSAGFEIADRIRDQMAAECLCRPAALVFADHGKRITEQIYQCCGLDKATGITSHVLLTASGTDSHRQAFELLRELDMEQAWCVLIVDAAETGRGVPDAFFPNKADVVCREIAIRDEHGMPLAESVIDENVLKQSEEAINQQRKVLLVMVDQSKSGCIAPSLSCATRLQQRFPAQLHILLDACQFRIANSTLQAYLKHGMMVAITGSKFLAGPSFSGALVVPDSNRVFDDMIKYKTNLSMLQPGSLIRWYVALASWQAFLTLDAAQAKHWLEQCAQRIEQRLSSDTSFLRLPGQNQRRGIKTTRWDACTTIFPFTLSQSCSGEPPVYADFATTLAIYKELQQSGDRRVQLGRPIMAGRRVDGVVLGAMRLCISAPMIVDAIHQPQLQEKRMNSMMAALDRVAYLARKTGGNQANNGL